MNRTKKEQKKYRDTHPQYTKKENDRKIEEYRRRKLEELISKITDKVFNEEKMKCERKQLQ